MEDLSHSHQRPKLEDYPDQVLLVAYGAKVDDSTGQARLHEVDVIAGKGWALTSMTAATSPGVPLSPVRSRVLHAAAAGLPITKLAP